MNSSDPRFRIIDRGSYVLLETIANVKDEYDADDDFSKSIDECYRVIRERMAAGGPGWQRKEAEE